MSVSAANEDETMSATQTLGMTIQCLADLAEEGFEDSELSPLDSNRTVANGFIPQESDQRVELRIFFPSNLVHSTNI